MSCCAVQHHPTVCDCVTVYSLVCDNDSLHIFTIISTKCAVTCKAKTEDQAGALKKKMATPEYAGRTPAKIKESDVDTYKLGKLLKEQQSLNQQLSDMGRLLQPQ